MNKYPRASALTVIFALTGSPAGYAAGDTPSNGSESEIKRLQGAMTRHRDRALAWTRMTYFNEAERELREADRVFQAIRALEDPKQPIQGAYPTMSWDLSHELEMVRLRAKAHRLMLRDFKLPEKTIAFIQAKPYARMDQALWYVIYTVAPDDLTKEKIAVDPMRYYGFSQIPGSQSFIASYSIAEHAPRGGRPDFQRRALARVPQGCTPTYVRLNHGGTLLVLTTSAPLKENGGDPTGAVLVRNGALVELRDGVFAGPVIVPRARPTRITSLATGGSATSLFLLREKDEDAVLGVYRGSLWHFEERVQFKGQHIVRIEHNRTVSSQPTWVPIFRAGQDARLLRNVVEQLGRFYGLRYEFRRHRVVTHSNSFREPSVTFDLEKRQWRIQYKWGRMEIAGGRRTITLDEYGKLIGIEEFLVLR